MHTLPLGVTLVLWLLNCLARVLGGVLVRFRELPHVDLLRLGDAIGEALRHVIWRLLDDFRRDALAVCAAQVCVSAVHAIRLILKVACSLEVDVGETERALFVDAGLEPAQLGRGHDIG